MRLLGYLLLVWKIGQPISVRQADSSGVTSGTLD
jgi:hypothetical protein